MENQEEIHHFPGWEGGSRGTIIVNKTFVNKLAFPKYKKIVGEIHFVKLEKYFPALIQNLATLVWFLCNIHATPRRAHGSYKKNRRRNEFP